MGRIRRELVVTFVRYFLLWSIALGVAFMIEREFDKEFARIKEKQAEIRSMIFEHDQRNHYRYQAIQERIEELHRLVMPKERHPLLPKPEPEPPVVIRARH